jgi:two-component system OmpR family response regulator
VAAKCILVLEDEPLVRDVITAQLRTAGYQVIEARDAGEALRTHRSGGIDVLFADIRMAEAPEGWTIVERLRDLNPTIGVVYAADRPGEPPSRDPNSRLVRKPFRVAEVVEAIRSLDVAPTAPSQ